MRLAAPARVAAAMQGSEAIALFHLLRSDGQVGHRNEYMIDFHLSKSRAPAKVAFGPRQREGHEYW